MKKIRFLYTQDFRKAFKALSKKYPSLHEDFEFFLGTLEINPIWYPPSVVRISGLWDSVYIPIYKLRKFAVECMQQTNSGIRIVYAYDGEENCIEFVEFVEIYHKNHQENHDAEKLRKIYKGKTDLPSWYATEEWL